MEQVSMGMALIIRDMLDYKKDLQTLQLQLSKHNIRQDRIKRHIPCIIEMTPAPGDSTEDPTIVESQPENLIFVLSYKWKYVQITQSLSSKAIQLSVQSLYYSQIVKGFSQTFSSALQASYFLAQFVLGSNAATCVNWPHHTLIKPRSNCAILKEIIPSAWMSFLYRKNPPTDSTLSLPLISTRSLIELTCMSYL